ncbi:MAG: integrase domain-containing protein [Thermomonas sp.]|uniref:integrase domain-containing protein n=1 Tax=Thermomonas sp. TaxID=1971895 RepID=UPI001D2D74DB|nr:integrase domain-containing protein [Thermomonas sp.]MBZ0087187.1 integrase domain-containing protein [Thermomonas sp.]
MSRKTEFHASIVAVMARLGGSHLTREARERTAAKFSKLMYEAGYTHLARPADISGKHLRAYIAARQAEAPGVRTLQNELAHLRSVLRSVGKHTVASAAELSNEALGISGGSRLGTKTAMSSEDFQTFTERAERQGRPGMAALLRLERYLGLRGNEAIHAREDTLCRWERELQADVRITVLAGTKGGRPRTVNVFDWTNASAAISSALTVCAKQGGYLVIRANGSPAGGLMQARRIYHSWAHRIGIQPHSARYAFARNQLDGYLSRGYSSREALMAVSQDLGHGDGRGRWVKSVYMR